MNREPRPTRRFPDGGEMIVDRLRGGIRHARATAVANLEAGETRWGFDVGVVSSGGNNDFVRLSGVWAYTAP